MKRKIFKQELFLQENILRQPMCKGKKRVSNNGLKNSDNIMKNGVLLPLHHGMTKDMFERLHSTINEFLRTQV